MSTPYCGARDTPKGRRPGTFEQCKKSGQIRRYGTFRIDELMSNDKKKIEPEKKKIISSKKDIIKEKIEPIKKVEPINKVTPTNIMNRHILPIQEKEINAIMKTFKIKDFNAKDKKNIPAINKILFDQEKMIFVNNRLEDNLKDYERSPHFRQLFDDDDDFITGIKSKQVKQKYKTVEKFDEAIEEIKKDINHNKRGMLQLQIDFRKLEKQEPTSQQKKEPIKKVKPIKKDFLDDVIIRHLFPGQLDKIKRKIKRPKNKAEEVIKKPLLIEEINNQLKDNSRNINFNIRKKLWKRHEGEDEDVSGSPFILKYATAEIAHHASKVEIRADMAHNQTILNNLK